MRVDGTRLWRTLEQFAEIGATPAGGVQRVALSEADSRARELLTRLAGDAGCSTRVDRIGNVFCRREGAESNRPAIMIGSHLDTQPDGGRFDGALGVIAGLEVMRVLEQHDIELPVPIELVNWTDEEGARFEVSCIGSSVFAGALPLDEAIRLVDSDGVSLRAALDELGLAGTAPIGTPTPGAYLELHIEQGPGLEDDGTTIGVVEGVVGIEWLTAHIHGATAHAGTTPPAARRDALLAAAEVIQLVDAVAARRAPLARGTVCALRADPSSGSVIVGDTELLIDLRHFDAAELEAMVAEVAEHLQALELRGLETELRAAWRQAPVAFDRGCIAAIERAAEKLGCSRRRMLSGAGHDAGYLAAVAPAAMIFIPCADGISHNPREKIEPSDAEAGANVLLEATLELAAATDS